MGVMVDRGVLVEIKGGGSVEVGIEEGGPVVEVQVGGRAKVGGARNSVVGDSRETARRSTATGMSVGEEGKRKVIMRKAERQTRQRVPQPPKRRVRSCQGLRPDRVGEESMIGCLSESQSRNPISIIF